MHSGLSYQSLQLPDGLHILPYLIGFRLTHVTLDIHSWISRPGRLMDSVATTLLARLAAVSVTDLC